MVLIAFRSCRFKRLDRVGRVDHAPDLVGERPERGHIISQASSHALVITGKRWPHFSSKLGSSAFLVGVGVDRLIDRLEVARDLLALAPRHVLQAVADQMHDTRLHRRVGEDRLDRGAGSHRRLEVDVPCV